jgi:peptidoglycan/LPS O-acetylase OafA/YrhL
MVLLRGMFARASTVYPADIRPLTALRFVAALVIVIYHFVLILPFDSAAVSGMLGKGYLGVDFFFILSGFILAHVYLDAAERKTLNPIAFYGRRLARVYPVHIFTLGLAVSPYVAAILGGVPETIPPHVQPHYFATNILMLHAWGYDDRYMFNVPSWSISAEWFAYLLFPYLAVAISRVRPALMLVLAVLFFWALFAFIATLPPGTGHLADGRPLTVRTFDFGIMRIVPEFILGMALYRFGRVWALRGPVRVWLVACTALLVGLVHFSVPDYVIVPLFAALIYLVAETARQERTGFLDRPWLVLMGEASYSLYMVHYLWIQLVFAVLVELYPGKEPAWVMYLCAVALFPVILWSALACYRRVEQPWRYKLWNTYSRFCLRA